MTTQIEKLNILLSENAISVEEFANCIGLDLKQARALCDGTKKLSKSLARQIEQTFSKPSMWLDTNGSDDGPNYDLFG